MKHAVCVFGSILLFAAVAGAQGNPASPVEVAAPVPQSLTSIVAPTADATFAYAPATPAPAGSLFSANSASAAEPASSDPAAQQVPGVQGVFQTYNLQAYFGYTFFRFDAVSHFSDNTNGVDLGIVYYPGGKWFGADGEFFGTWGQSIGGQGSNFVAGLGGGRVRWLAPHNIEVWGHGLLGISNFLPQTPLGKQAAFLYELGAGADLNIGHTRWALRFSGDMVATHYFSTFQYSPKFSGGVVFKF